MANTCPFFPSPFFLSHQRVCLHSFLTLTRYLWLGLGVSEDWSKRIALPVTRRRFVQSHRAPDDMRLVRLTPPDTSDHLPITHRLIAFSSNLGAAH